MLKKIVLSLAIGWAFLIAFLCLVRFGDLIKIRVSGIDKYVHFAFHFVFTMLWGYYSWLRHYELPFRNLFNIFAISLSYGVLIEILQETCTKTRHAEASDVLANFIGAMTALLVFWVLKKVKKA